MALARVCQSGLPATHFFVSLSRGDAIRTVMLRPAGLWAIVALAALVIVWAAAASAYIAFHDDLLSAMVARQAEMRSVYERRLAEAGARIDEAASRRELDLKSFAGKLNELMSRQGRLERRGAIVAALAETEAHNQPARSRGGPDRRRRSRRDPGSRAGRAGRTKPSDGAAYAPLPALAVDLHSPKPHPIDETDGGPGALPPPAPASSSAADDPDPAARLALLDRSLERMDMGQMKALAVIDRTAEREAARDTAVVARTGLDPARLTAPHGQAASAAPSSRPRSIRTRPPSSMRWQRPPATSQPRSASRR